MREYVIIGNVSNPGEGILSMMEPPGCPYLRAGWYYYFYDTGNNHYVTVNKLQVGNHPLDDGVSLSA